MAAANRARRRVARCSGWCSHPGQHRRREGARPGRKVELEGEHVGGVGAHGHPRDGALRWMRCRTSTASNG